MKMLSILICTVLLWGCGAATGRVNDCTGCFDANGTCLPGSEPSACGRNGANCVSAAACQSGAPADAGGMITQQDAGECSPEAKLIYLVDQNRTISSFDPDRIGTAHSPFVDLGYIGCSASPGAEPFSMAVDRTATAWVIYDSGELFTVNLKQFPLNCVKTGFAPQKSIAKFGMGFSANSPGSKDETLFISGSDFSSSLYATKFGTLMTSPPYDMNVLGVLLGAPELTGTGDGELWSFSPNVQIPTVARLSKDTGEIEAAYVLPSLMGSPRAWAFAFWGGDFYVFLERDLDSSTRVWKLNGTTGALSPAVPDTGRRIVGAGVSTCAPTAKK